MSKGTKFESNKWNGSAIMPQIFAWNETLL